MDQEPEFKVGDQVEIVKYGSGLFSVDKLNLKLIEELKMGYWYDMDPELVGQKGIVVKLNNNPNWIAYELFGPNKTAWYTPGQLKLLVRPNYI